MKSSFPPPGWRAMAGFALALTLATACAPVAAQPLDCPRQFNPGPPADPRWERIGAVPRGGWPLLDARLFADPPGTETGDPAAAIRPDFIAPDDTLFWELHAHRGRGLMFVCRYQTLGGVPALFRARLSASHRQCWFRRNQSVTMGRCA